MKTTALFLAILSLPILGRAEGPREQEAEWTANRLREKIQTEIETLGEHAWAGEYYQGDGLGMNVYLSLAPKTGYVYEWHSCEGLYDRNYGAIEDKGGVLRFSLALKKRPFIEGIAEKFIPIAWGDRKYLVPAKGFVEFCNEINAGSEPRKDIHGRILLRIGDERKPATDRPVIPKEFESYLLSKPIETEVIGVAKSKDTAKKGEIGKVTITVTLKDGSKAGLLPGMRLYVIDPDDHIVETVELTKVEEEQSEGVIIRYPIPGFVWGLLSLMMERDPKIGWEYSTQASWKVQRRQ